MAVYRCLNDSQVSIVSFNMHGFNQGHCTLNKLCSSDDLNIDVILLQEHWLTPDNMHKLRLFSTNYSCFGISAMENSISQGVLRGRPFGGVLILIKAPLNARIKYHKCSERLVAIAMGDYLFISAYFPKVCNSSDSCIVQAMFAEIEEIVNLNPNLNIILGGDCNTNIDINNQNSESLLKFIDSVGAVSCHGLINSNLDYTYCHDSLQYFSYIDYIFISRSISADLRDFKVLEVPHNLSDHLPIFVSLSIDNSLKSNSANINSINDKAIHKNLRWDHAALPVYYEITRQLLEPLSEHINCAYSSWVQKDNSNLYTDYDHGLSESNALNERSRPNSNTAANICSNNPAAQQCIDELYKLLVNALQTAANVAIPCIKSDSLKFWWNQEVKELKQKSCSTFSDWINGGRPKTGILYEAKRVAKAAYKRCIKENQKLEKEVVSNSLHDALICKSQNTFWKAWQNKFGKKKSSQKVINGLADNQCIADEFASYFSAACSVQTASTNALLYRSFKNRLSKYQIDSPPKPVWFDVEMIDSIITKLIKGKAAGFDSLTAEHFQFCHPIVVCMLSKLFNLMLKFNYVPNEFGMGLTVPIPKKDSKCQFDKVEDYRGITISPVVSKIFELCLLNYLKKSLATSDLQFGFKSGLGCNHAIYTLRSTVDYFVTNNSTINLCSLDLTKAFDRVNHYSLFLKLMDKNIARNVILLL